MRYMYVMQKQSNNTFWLASVLKARTNYPLCQYDLKKLKTKKEIYIK